MIDLLEKYDWKPYNHIVPCPISRKPSSPMVLLPRLSSRVRVALYGDKEGIADAERLEAERVEDFPEDDGEEFTWKAWSRRLSGSSKARGKPAKRAFDEFIAAVATHVSRDAAASLSANASGEVYDALRADNSSKKTRARAQVEAAFGIVKDWRSVVDAFESLNTFDNTKNETAAPKQEAEMMLEWADPDYVTVESKTQAPPTKEDGESSPEWLIAKCDSLKNQALSTLDVALGVVAAAKTDDPNAFQGQLFELLGFSDEAISVMGELCERQEYIARINPSSVRKALATSPPPSQGDTQQRTRQAGSVTINSASASKQSKKKRQKEQAKQQKNRTPVSEASDMLASLGFDPAYLEQERSLGLQKNVKPSSSHAHQLLDGQQREFFDVRGPAGERFFGDGYEEVVIDPPKRLDPPGPGELVDLDAAMPTWARKCFPSSTKSLNRIQSAVFEGVFHSQKNILVCAPTGAGKTYVALLSVLEVIKRHVESVLLDAAAAGKSSGGGARDKEEVAQLLSSHKIVYIAPLKALAQEVVQKFSERLQPLGLKVRELTGDVQLSRREADQAHVLVATPEKWDVVTRKQGTEGSLAARCRLLIIDEIHLLAEERGAVLECIVARTRRLVESSQLGVRLLGLSATLPNYADVAEFLACPDDGVFFFGPEFRPVPLKQTFIGVTEPKRLKAAAKLDEIAYETALDAIDRGHQVMIFVHSRRDTAKTAMYFRDRAAREGRDGVFASDDPAALKQFKQALDKARHGEMRDLAPAGLTVHHAGMSRSDRGIAENMFAHGAVKVLCCTATLAWGVNLPAHAVVCKGTEVYVDGKWTDISMLDVLQIFGRAGRPQFDDFGEATLITSHKALPSYLRKLARSAPIESCLVSRLSDSINAEIAAGTISSLRDAVSWMSHTFLDVRIRKNPMAYGISLDAARLDPTLSDERRKLCHKAVEDLNKAHMARYNKKSGVLSGTDIGRVGSHYYLRYESVGEFIDRLRENATDAAILVVICSAFEFEQLKPRPEEIAELDRLRVSPACPLHMRSIVRRRDGTETSELIAIADEPAGKAACLFEAHISRAPISSFTLASDAAYVAKNAARVCRALFEMALRAKYGMLAERLLSFAKAVERRIWWFQTPIRQLADLEQNANSRHRNFPEDAMKNLEAKNMSLDRLLVDCSDGADVGALVRNQKAGKSFVNAARMIPVVELEVDVVPITRTVLQFKVSLVPEYEWSGRVHGTAPEPFHLWLTDYREVAGQGWVERLHHYEIVNLMPPKKTPTGGRPQRKSVEGATVAFTISLHGDTLPSQFFVRAHSDRWFGSSALFEISTNRLKLPAIHSQHTDLLPLHPLPISALENAKFQSLYGFSHFNPVQTQMFHSLFHTDKNILLGAPTGSGKTLCAELAVMRMLAARVINADDEKRRAHTKAVYVAPLKALARERLKDWQRKFRDKLGLSVQELTGDATPDARALRDADILITTPEKWDGVTRMWKRRDYVRAVSLLIIDEIHLLGEDRGPVIESIVARLRFNESDVRIVGLSTAISNAHDLGEWLGVDKKNLFNFRPAVRPVPCKPHIAGFPGKHYCPRMATMNKPCYAAILEHARAAPALVFVASRRQTRLTALDLISLAAADDSVVGGAAALWVDASAISEVEAEASRCQDASLRQCLVFGVGIHHAGLPERDREVVEKLFEAKKIRVLISTSTLAWGVNLPARLVVVKGTEYFDGKLGKYVDYPVTDILQMMGRAGRPQFDDMAVAVILVHEPKKEFLKTMLYSPFPIESHLVDRLHNTLMAEVCATGAIHDKSGALDYMKCTFLYHRLKENPSYYHVEEYGETSVMSFLSGLVDTTMKDLAEAGSIEIEDDDIKPATLGRIASYYYLDYRTTRDADVCLPRLEDDVLARFSPIPKFRDAGRDDDGRIEAELEAIELLCAAREFDELPVRHNEDVLNEELADSLGMTDRLFSFDDPHVKAQLLLHARLRGARLPIADYTTDTRSVLENCSRVLAALVDVAANAGALRTTLALCRLSQALGSSCSFAKDELCQLGVDEETARNLRSSLGLSREQGVRDAIRRRRFKQVAGSSAVKSSEAMRSETSLEATLENPDSPGNSVEGNKVQCDATCALRVQSKIVGGNGSRRTTRDNEGWWLVLAEDDDLLALKRVSMRGGGGRGHASLDTKLIFAAPENTGPASLRLYALADNCRGFDATLDIHLDVV